VYPDAVGPHRFWNISSSDPTAPDDVGFVTALLDRLERSLCVDHQRVYATGVSNGGGMAARLGCQLGSRIAAIAPVAGGYRSLPQCKPTRPLSVLEIHGTADPVVPYDGKPPDYAGSVPHFLDVWTEHNHCPPQQPPVWIAPRTQRLAWGPCDDDTDVEHLKLSGVGHTWPGAPGSGAAVNASREVWLFFRGRVLAPAPPPS